MKSSESFPPCTYILWRNKMASLLTWSHDRLVLDGMTSKWVSLFCCIESADSLDGRPESRRLIEHFAGPVFCHNGASLCRKWWELNRTCVRKQPPWNAD